MATLGVNAISNVSAYGLNMGLNFVGDPNLIFTRKNRFTFTVTFGNITVPPYFVKSASRPNITFEETEVNFLNGKMFLPGKGTFETMTLTYMNVATAYAAPLYNWLASVYNFTGNGVPYSMGSRVADYAGTGTLVVYDGCGQSVEQWVYYNMWPQAINFGDVDYASSDTIDIELTARYATVQYTNLCPGFNINGNCTPCGAQAAAPPTPF